MLLKIAQSVKIPALSAWTIALRMLGLTLASLLIKVCATEIWISYPPLYLVRQKYLFQETPTFPKPQKELFEVWESANLSVYKCQENYSAAQTNVMLQTSMDNGIISLHILTQDVHN